MSCTNIKAIQSFTAACVVYAALLLPALAQGPLTPPGAPASTMKTLQQVEPRTPIESLPITLLPGSYYLTQDLVGSAVSDGITIKASDVTIDLNGFSLIGAGGTSDAIDVSGVRSNITVRNGTIEGWGAFGIHLSSTANILCEDLRVQDCGTTAISVGPGSRVLSCRANSIAAGHGVSAGPDSLVQDCVVNDIGGSFSGIEVGINGRVIDCVVSRCGGDGINTDEHCLVSGSTAYDNSDDGISAASGTVVSDCVMNDNQFRGISASQGCIVENCLARDNGFDGYYASFSSSFRNCVASRNGTQGFFLVGQCTIENCVASLNGEDGIEAGNECRIVDNQCMQNGFGAGDGAGILVTGNDGQIEGNQVLRGDRGIEVTGSSNDVAANKVRDNTTNYLFADGNHLNLLLSQIPQTISWPAQVKLAGTLTNTGNDDGITVAANDVTIDLDGHALRATGGITGTDGISINDGVTNTVVRNGSVQGWAGIGVRSGANAVGVVVEALTVRDSGLSGMKLAGSGSVVRNCHFSDNADRGVETEGGSLLESCTAQRNGTLGFDAGLDTVLRNCLAKDNEYGIVAGRGSQLFQCKAAGSIVRGFDLQFFSVAEGCTSIDNGESGFWLAPDCVLRNCTASDNGAHGFDTGARCILENNVASGNGQSFAGGAGFLVDVSDNRLIGNTATFNPYGFHADSSFLTQNYSENNDTNYVLNACDYGKMVIDPGPAFVISTPWSNFAKD